MSDSEDSAVPTSGAGSQRRALEDLRYRYPETPFLALGQTIWWDEPMKAVLRRLLDEVSPDARMVLGVHDTDYFAKVKVRRTGRSRFELMAHNDGATRDLWSAAGEISTLFGAECIPSRHDLKRHGVPVDKLASSEGHEPQEFVDAATQAWGWRGLVYTGSRDLIVHKLPLRDMGDSVERMLQWGFDGTIESIADQCCKEEARGVAARLLQWVADYRVGNPSAMLSDLYQAILPRLYELLLGAPPRNVDVACSAHMLLLSPETAHLPRFEFVDLFLNEKTRALAAEAYNQAVAGTEIYTLDKFGLGALPFDLVLPEQGRGTLRVTLRAIHVETRKPIRIRLKRPVTSVRQLAEVLQAELGEHITLVGKAVALISMLAREFIFVFNEEGSGYVRLTRKMNDFLRAHRVPMVENIHPILRIRYHTWDAIAANSARIKLPEHLAASFCRDEIAPSDFAAEWEGDVRDQLGLLTTIKGVRKPRDLMRFLSSRTGNGWPERLAAYDAAKQRLLALREQGAAIQAEVDRLYVELAETKQGIVDAERQKASHFHSVADWTPEETSRRAAFDERIASLLHRRRAILATIHARKAERFGIERGPDAVAARGEVARIEREADLERLNLVRNAILTSQGLVHTNHRPSAWWVPMLDSSGRWFERILRTAELYTELLLSPIDG